MAAFGVSFVVFVLVQTIEHFKGGPLFTIPGMEPYMKDLGEPEEEVEIKDVDVSKSTKKEEISEYSA